MGETLTREEWTRQLEDGMEGLKKQIGIRKEAPIMGEGDFHTNEMPLCNRVITKDMIRLYASALGDFNPLWVNEEYAKQTKWGGIIAPPMCEVMIAEAAAVPPPLEIPGLSYMNGGSTRKYYNPIRPGDEFRAYDTFKAVVDKTNPAKPYRLFITTGEREIINQRDELVLTITSNIMIVARYPEPGKGQKALDFSQEKRRCYTDEELEIFHQSYDEEIQGTNRFGKGKRDWDSVNIGDELVPVYKGPYDYADAVSFFAVTGFSMAFAKKWYTMRGNLNAFYKNSETNEYTCGPEWHFDDEIARKRGVPFAPIFGTHIEASMLEGVTNWMGDEARVAVVSSQIRKMIFMGDVFICKGKVADKYEEDGKKLVKFELWAEKYGTDIVSATGYAIVEL
ncbi:MAG: MaoC family dehydratase N-terminal domain-containing protein [Parasporobacterium sp.]|nr:MaoC family dehydratase N-terminal domain-containing protein [Parasporobacterium sp.]